jgi:2-polyprenyl-6-methoxyphenol hydroxylase-like FAD-dependent oxidoreductase
VRTSEIDILVVGAGPSGLALAAALAQLGASFRLIDDDDGPTDQSRAALVHVRTLELFDKLGVVDAALERGVKLHGVNLMTRGERIAYVPLAGAAAIATPYPFILSLRQADTERLLLDEIGRHGEVVEWGTTLVGFSQDEGGVDAVLRNPAGRFEDVRARWLVGSDGARSVVRRLLGIGFGGGAYEQTAFLADVRLDPDFEPDKLNLNLANFGIVGIEPFGEGWYRLFGALSPAYAARFSAQVEGAAVRADILQQWFEEYFRLRNRITEVGWTSFYRIHRRLADRFQVDRCFLIGDAAHIHSPAGGQGMNLGIGDGLNLSWKLGLVATGAARPELLASYAAERRPVARRIVDGADRGFELEATNNRLMEAFRIHVAPPLLGLAIRLPATRRVVARLLSQTWISYRGSPAVAANPDRDRRRGPCPGDRAPMGAFEVGPDAGRGLHEVLRGMRHRLLVFEGAKPGPPLERLVAEATEQVDGFGIEIGIVPVLSGNRVLHGLYGSDRPTLALIRPDGHVAFCGGMERAAELGVFLARWFPARRPTTLDEAPRTEPAGTA